MAWGVGLLGWLVLICSARAAYGWDDPILEGLRVPDPEVDEPLSRVSGGWGWSAVSTHSVVMKCPLMHQRVLSLMHLSPGETRRLCLRGVTEPRGSLLRARCAGLHGQVRETGHGGGSHRVHLVVCIRGWQATVQ